MARTPPTLFDLYLRALIELQRCLYHLEEIRRGNPYSDAELQEVLRRGATALTTTAQRNRQLLDSEHGLFLDTLIDAAPAMLNALWDAESEMEAMLYDQGELSNESSRANQTRKAILSAIDQAIGNTPKEIARRRWRTRTVETTRLSCHSSPVPAVSARPSTAQELESRKSLPSTPSLTLQEGEETMAGTSRTQRIAELNDLCRTAPGVAGRWVQTHGIDALAPDVQSAIREKVEAFDVFTPDNDPHGEHDFGQIDHEGLRVYWKIDYYALDMEYGSEDPADPAQTVRVLTLMLAEEY